MRPVQKPEDRFSFVAAQIIEAKRHESDSVPRNEINFA